VELGFVTSVWRGVKSPKLFSGESSISSCMAFRVIALDMDPDAVESLLHYQLGRFYLLSQKNGTGALIITFYF